MTIALTADLIELNELKDEVRRYWQRLHRSNMAIIQPENFEPEVSHLFGDLQQKHTWEKAYSHFFVAWVYDCVMDGDTYFQILDPSDWRDWERELTTLIVEAIMAHPRTASLVQASYSYLVTCHREELANGFFRMVERSAGEDWARPTLAIHGSEEPVRVG